MHIPYGHTLSLLTGNNECIHLTLTTSPHPCNVHGKLLSKCQFFHFSRTFNLSKNLSTPYIYFSFSLDAAAQSQQLFRYFLHHTSVSGRIASPGRACFVHACARATELLEKTNQQCHSKNSWHRLLALTTNPPISSLPFSTLCVFLCSFYCLTPSIIDPTTSCNSGNADPFTFSSQICWLPALLLSCYGGRGILPLYSEAFYLNHVSYFLRDQRS